MFVKTFFRWPVVPVAIGALLFAFAVETMQYFRLVEVLGLQDNAFARVVIGTSFSWLDMLCYVVGAAIVVATENYSAKKKPGRSF